MLWHFELVLKNGKTGETKRYNFDIVTIDNYFDAWKVCVDRAKDIIDTMERPFEWYIATLTDTMRR